MIISTKKRVFLLLETPQAPAFGVLCNHLDPISSFQGLPYPRLMDRCKNSLQLKGTALVLVLSFAFLWNWSSKMVSKFEAIIKPFERIQYNGFVILVSTLKFMEL
ncbi:hypothetical protein [Algoriphagus boritolerans]|uniref:hypothetical protein n=1 Tax=Algoriphagus boritolerans TaxID=308111 RepID=UPI000B2AE39E